MTRWYVVFTRSREEERASWHLNNQGLRCFLPKFRKIRRHARKAEPVLELLFPRYLFVNFNPAETAWRAVNGTRGVIALLADGSEPKAVPRGVVEALQAHADSEGVIPLTALNMLRRGLKVRIKIGPFRGQVGEIADILSNGRDRVQLLLQVLGVQTSLQLPSYAIEAA
jgi:transcriptional antiterminator RfaH